MRKLPYPFTKGSINPILHKKMNLSSKDLLKSPIFVILEWKINTVSPSNSLSNTKVVILPFKCKKETINKLKRKIKKEIKLQQKMAQRTNPEIILSVNNNPLYLCRELVESHTLNLLNLYSHKNYPFNHFLLLFFKAPLHALLAQINKQLLSWIPEKKISSINLIFP